MSTLLDSEVPLGGALYRSRGRHRQARRPGRIIVIASLLAGSLSLLSTVAWIGARAAPVRADLVAAAELVRQLEDRLSAHDVTGARGTLAALQDRTGRARATTSALDWGVSTRVPELGDDLAAVRTLAQVLDDLDHTALPTIVDLMAGFDLARALPHDGRVDLDGLRRAAPDVATVAAAARSAADRVAAISSADLVQPLREAIGQLAAGLDQLVALTTTAERISALVPAMLGAGGQRTYLVLVQDLTQVRATGGVPGAFLVVRADGGAVTVLDRGSTTDLATFDQPVLSLDPDQAGLYTDRMGRVPADVNMGPYFPTSAALAREMYRRHSGTTVDGVIAADPVVLAGLLRATGPLWLGTGPDASGRPSGVSLTSDGVLRLLGSGGSTVDRDRFAAAAGGMVLDALARGLADPRTALDGLARAAGERRLLVWNADAGEQSMIAGTTLEGAMPLRDGSHPTVGLFLDDAGGAKLGAYLTHVASLDVTGCRIDGRRELALRATLRSTAPAQGLAAEELSTSGDPYTLRLQTLIFSPTGGSVAEVRLDGVVQPYGAGVERNRQVAVLPVDLAPGQSRTVDVRLFTDALAADVGPIEPELWVTPGVNPWPMTVASDSDCPHLR